MLEESPSSSTSRDKAMDTESQQPAPPDGPTIEAKKPDDETTAEAQLQEAPNVSANSSSCLLDTSQQSGKRKRKRKHNRALKTAMAQAARTVTNGPSHSPVGQSEPQPAQQSTSQGNRPARLRPVDIPPLSMVTAPFFRSCHCCCSTHFYGPQAPPPTTSRLGSRPFSFHRYYHNPNLSGLYQPSFRYFRPDRPYAMNRRKANLTSPPAAQTQGDPVNASKASVQAKERESMDAAHTKKCLEIDFGEPDERSDQPKIESERNPKERGESDHSVVDAIGSAPKTRTSSYKRTTVNYGPQRSRKQTSSSTLHSNAPRSRHKAFHHDQPSASNHSKAGSSFGGPGRGSRSRFFSTGSVSYHPHHYHHRHSPPPYHGGGRHGKHHFVNNHQNGGYRQQHQSVTSSRYDLRDRHPRPKAGGGGPPRRGKNELPPPSENDILRKEIAHAPKNDNEYLMREHYKDYASPLFSRALSHTCSAGGPEGQTSSEDHHSSTDSEAEFLEREFAEEYELVRTERLQSMSKDELLREVLCLEAKLEERERELFEFKERKIRESSL